MTSYHEVHLFAWIKENAAIIGAFFLVMWAMIVWSFNSFFKARDSKFATVYDLNSCRDKNTAEHNEIRKQISRNHDEVKNLFITHLGKD